MPKVRALPIDTSKMRRRNLSAVLDLVHRLRGISRADLTRILGLNRSTIGDLVALLVSGGWVAERADESREGVGRPSPLVVSTNQWLVAAINPELDVIDIALVSLGGEIIQRRRVSVEDPTVAEVVAVVSKVVRELALLQPGSKVLAAGVAVPGLVRREDGVVRLAPGLGWKDEPLANQISASLEIPVFAANDAHLGCRAELNFGAGQGASSVLYLNGGPSGIGGGLVIDGSPVDGSAGYAGEIGHFSVDPSGPKCACGASGCLEALVKRSALVRTLGLSHPDDDELDLALQNAVAQDGGHELRSFVAEQIEWLSIALRSVVNLLNPERIVLGGHLASLWLATSQSQRDSVLSQALPVNSLGVKVTVAALGSQRLLIGAAELAWDDIISDPLESVSSFQSSES